MATTHALYTNQVLENQMTDLVNTKLEVNSLFTVDNSLSTEAGLKKVVNKYTYTGAVEKLAKGAKIRVTGTKTSWSGEIEIADVTKLEILEGNYVAPVTDVTELLGKDELVNKQNMLGSFKNLTVAASTIKDDATEYAFLYNWDGSGTDGSDIYFNVTDGTNVYTFVVETDLCPATSDVYAAVKALKVGDKIDVEGFLYWYNGIQLHTTAVTVAQ